MCRRAVVGLATHVRRRCWNHRRDVGRRMGTVATMAMRTVYMKMLDKRPDGTDHADANRSWLPVVTGTNSRVHLNPICNQLAKTDVLDDHVVALAATITDGYATLLRPQTKEWVSRRKVGLCQHCGAYPSEPDDWKTGAACRGNTDVSWFPLPYGATQRQRLDNIKQAKQICWECPVASQCDTYAVRMKESRGIWAGQDRRPV